MSAAIISSLITGGLAFLGVLVTSLNNKNKIVNDLKTEFREKQAVTNTEIKELTREVREHNGFARRIPVVEEQIKEINHRVEILERKG